MTPRMQRHQATIAIALAISLGTTASAQDKGLAAARGTCTDGSPRTYMVVDGTSSTDCTTGGGTTDVQCCCMNGSWAACGGGGGGDSFATWDTSSGTNPAADSASDTMTVTCLGPLTCPGDSTTDTITFQLDAWDVGEIVWSSITTTGFITSGGKVTGRRIPQGSGIADGALHINPDSATTPMHASFIYEATWNTADIGTNNRPALADLDSDGDLDLLIGETVGVSLGYENTGSIAAPVWTVKTAWNTADIGTNSAPTFGDLDADGDIDLIIGSQLGVNYAYKNTGSASSPTWAAEATWDTADVGAETMPYLADFDADGDLDLMIGETNGIALAYRNTGSASAPAWTAVASLNSADVGIVAAPILFDTDLDGDLDLYIGSNGGLTYGYRNTGNVSIPVWTREAAYDIADIGSNSSPAVGDLDGDDDLDLMMGESGGLAYGYDNVGSTVRWTDKNSWDAGDFGSIGAAYGVGDMDGDGDLDIMYADGSANGFVVGVKNTGTPFAPTWSAEASWDTADLGTGTGATVGDLDGDGDNDIMYGITAGCCYGLENTGTTAAPSWAAKAAWDFAAFTASSRPHLVDIDGDGDLDVYEANINGIHYAYQNTGTTSAPTWSYTSGWNVVDIGSNGCGSFADLDGDGDLDMISGEAGGTYFYAVENTGTASVPAWTRNMAWAVWTDLTASAACAELFDMDGDGDADLMAQENAGQLRAYENTGSLGNNNTLLGVGFNGSQTFRASAEGNIEVAGDARIDGSIMVGNPSSSVSSGCIAMEATKDRLYWDRDCDGVQDVSEGHLDGLGAKGQLIGKLLGANFNVTTDQSIPMQSTSYIVEEVLITNASLSLTTAAGGVYTAASKGGSAIIAAATVYTSLTAAAKYYRPAVAGTATTDVLTGVILYFSLTTAQGAAATADIYVFGTRLN